MFAIFYGIYNTVMAGINGIDKNFQNSTARAKAMDLKEVVYFSGGQMYLTENGRQVVKSWDKYTGHDVIKDIRNGKVYYDLTIIKQEQEIKKYISEGRTVYEIDKKDEPTAWYHKRRTGIYCIKRDIETKHFVHEIWINKYRFYLDIHTGKLLRLTDDNINKLDYYTKRGIYRNEPLSYNDIIYYFNERQNRLSKHENYNYSGGDWMEKVYYLSRNVRCRTQLFMNQNGRLVYGNYITELTVFGKYGDINVNTGDYI